jgi:release factor glutamine methyltransferase
MVNHSSRILVESKAIQHWRLKAIASAKVMGINPVEVDLLLAKMTTLTKLDLRLESYLTQESIPSHKSLIELTQLWEQRIKENVPLQYLTNTAYWRDFELEVSQDVLIPRPETEMIIDLAKDAITASPNPELSTGIWVDLGTGSGAIAFGLADLFPNATIYAIDISVAALAIATANAKKLNLDKRINFQQGCWWSRVEQLQGKISAMVSNPPYIPTAMIPHLQPEVTLHEPHLALDGGENGLQCLQYLVETAPDYLCSGGIWLTEIMAGQGQQVVEMLKKQGNYHQIKIYNDLADLDSFVLAYRK